MDSEVIETEPAEEKQVKTILDVPTLRRGLDVEQKDVDAEQAAKRDGELLDLCDAFLHKADLQRLNLSNAHFIDADLTGADLTGTNLYKSNFSGADLRGAKVNNANTTDSDLVSLNVNGLQVYINAVTMQINHLSMSHDAWFTSTIADLNDQLSRDLSYENWCEIFTVLKALCKMSATKRRVSFNKLPQPEAISQS